MSNGTQKPDSQWALCEKLIACCRVAEILLSENVHLTTPRPPKHGATEGDDWLAHLARERFLLLLLLIDERSLRNAKENTKRSINQIPSWKSLSKHLKSFLFDYLFERVLLAQPMLYFGDLRFYWSMLLI